MNQIWGNRIEETGWLIQGCVLLWLLLGICSPTYGVVNIQKLLRSAKKGPTQEMVQTTQTDIISFGSRLTQRLYDLRNLPEKRVNISEVKKHLAKLSKKINAYSLELRFLKNTNHLNYNHIQFYKTNLIRINAKILKINASLSYVIRQLMQQRKSWIKERETLLKWRAFAMKMGPLSIEWKAYKNAEATIHKALVLYNKRLDPLLSMEERIAEVQGKLHEIFLETDQWSKGIKGNIFERNTPIIFSGNYFAQFHKGLWKTTWREIRSFISQQGEHITDDFWLLLKILTFTILLTILIHHSKRALSETQKWNLFARKPFNTSLFLCLYITQVFASPLPPGWQAFFQFFVIASVIFLSKEFFKETWKWQLLYRFAILLMIVSMFRMVILPKPLLRILVLLTASAALLLSLWVSLPLYRKRETSLLTWILRLSIIILSIIVLSEIVGYASFSIYVLRAYLLTIFIVLEIWMLYLIATGFLELVLQKAPVAIVQQNAKVILSRIKPLLNLFFAILFITSNLVTWQIYTTGNEAIQHLLSIGFAIGNINITINLLLTAALVLYCFFLLSWGVQALLLQEILPRRRVTRGVQLSIARLVHYGIVSIGVLLTLRTLGFGLTNLTIIGGALGVGIGFGLQAIVNNFASGLILLFERPIKIGDTIQIDNDVAVVKRLGLRSTVVQTLDNAEIVIPNSDLVTHKVTNWTLANRLVRVRIPVSVAYGSDIDKVTQLLVTCAKENPKVLKHPEAQALFLGFGDSALNFELRVWISEFMDSTGEVQSELNSMISERFSKAGIEIPFPQTDLHLRSIDEKAARSIRGETGESPNNSSDSPPLPKNPKEVKDPVPGA